MIPHDPTFITWWNSLVADAELCGYSVNDDDIILSSSVSGGGFTVTAGDIRKMCDNYRKLLYIAYQLWGAPNDAYVVENEYYSVFGHDGTYTRTFSPDFGMRGAISALWPYRSFAKQRAIIRSMMRTIRKAELPV